MDHKKIQDLVNKVFTEAFVHTPLTKRLEDISGECKELCNYSNLSNLKEETGDLLASLIQLCNESGWDIFDLIKENEAKIKRRMLQYKSLGRKTQVAIIGGAFDPVTVGHIEMAKFILMSSRWADEVWFMPTFQHMDGKKMESPNHRLKMLELATINDGRIKVSDFEIKNELKGETYHMLNKITHDSEYENYRFAFVIGMDRANTIDSWYNYEELLKMDVPFIISPRKGYQVDQKNNWYMQKPHMYIHEEENFPVSNISSSEIRKTLLNFSFLKEEVVFLEEMLDEMVLKYIINNELYKSV